MGIYGKEIIQGNKYPTKHFIASEKPEKLKQVYNYLTIFTSDNCLAKSTYFSATKSEM